MGRTISADAGGPGLEAHLIWCGCLSSLGGFPGGWTVENGERDRFHLARFVEAQAGVYEQVCAELRAGRKRSHWMWFVFPQIRGLGNSEMAVRYAISGREEARAYLEHSVLGPRLRECAGIVVGLEGWAGSGKTASEIFGYPDDLKFHSSMTLFAEVEDPSESVFHEALKKYFGGKTDRKTLELI